jgi:hypothetical protein
MAGRTWTQAEIDYLKEWYGKKSAEQIAEDLGRTKSSVQTKAREPALDLSDDRGRKLWTEEEVEFLKQNYLALGADQCAKQLGRSVSSVHGKILKVGGGRPSIGPKVEWSEQELDFLRENYQKMSWEELVQHLGRTEQAIQVRASMLGMQRYVDPYKFFETWTEQSAYVIGFFAADGWISKRGPESIRIGFGQKDRDVLDSIRDAIGVGEVYPKSNGMHRYYIQSVRVYERLCDIFGNDVHGKSHTLQWPNIPDEYVRHFLRGSVDGDGSLFRNNQDHLWRFDYTTSSKSFIDSVVDVVEQMTGVHLNPGINKINVWHARTSGIKAVCLADWLYRDAAIALKRKAEFAQRMMEHRGMAYAWNLTPKMRETFPHILERYEIVERVAQ